DRAATIERTHYRIHKDVVMADTKTSREREPGHKTEADAGRAESGGKSPDTNIQGHKDPAGAGNPPSSGSLPWFTHPGERVESAGTPKSPEVPAPIVLAVPSGAMTPPPLPQSAVLPGAVTPSAAPVVQSPSAPAAPDAVPATSVLKDLLDHAAGAAADEAAD